jgi:hypothetical protein
VSPLEQSLFSRGFRLLKLVGKIIERFVAGRISWVRGMDARSRRWFPSWATNLRLVTSVAGSAIRIMLFADAA